MSDLPKSEEESSADGGLLLRAMAGRVVIAEKRNQSSSCDDVSINRNEVKNHEEDQR